MSSTKQRKKLAKKRKQKPLPSDDNAETWDYVQKWFRTGQHKTRSNTKHWDRHEHIMIELPMSEIASDFNYKHYEVEHVSNWVDQMDRKTGNEMPLPPPAKLTPSVCSYWSRPNESGEVATMFCVFSGLSPIETIRHQIADNITVPEDAAIAAHFNVVLFNKGEVAVYPHLASCLYRTTGEGVQLTSNRCIFGKPRGTGNDKAERFMNDVAFAVKTFNWAHSFAQQPAVNVREVPRSKKAEKWREAHKIPPTVKSTIDIGLPHIKAGPVGQRTVHRDRGVARHVVRGHWRNLSNGKQTWVRSHWKGDLRYGYVDSKYKIHV